MSKNYHHLNLSEREQLAALRYRGFTFEKIGEILGRDRSCLSREFKKNSKFYRQYQPCLAQKRADRVATKQRTKAALKSHEIYLFVRKGLRKKWSPETIAGRLPIDLPGNHIDDDTIYEYVYNYRKTRGEQLWQHLVLHRKHRMKKEGRKVKNDKYINVLNIGQRPKSVSKRKTVGHWETDNVEGKKSDSISISTTVERKTRFTILSKLKGHSSKVKTEAVINRLGQLPKPLVKTITTDRGPENHGHREITKVLKVKVYFCNPYHSWEKGTVENTNGRIRRFLPKGKTLENLTESYLKRIENQLNNTPRKCLKFRTPNEMLQLQINRLGALQLRM
jgi:transposase, IS30 family